MLDKTTLLPGPQQGFRALQCLNIHIFRALDPESITPQYLTNPHFYPGLSMVFGLFGVSNPSFFEPSILRSPHRNVRQISQSFSTDSSMNEANWDSNQYQPAILGFSDCSAALNRTQFCTSTVRVTVITTLDAPHSMTLTTTHSNARHKKKAHMQRAPKHTKHAHECANPHCSERVQTRAQLNCAVYKHPQKCPCQQEDTNVQNLNQLFENHNDKPSNCAHPSHAKHEAS